MIDFDSDIYSENYPLESLKFIQDYWWLVNFKWPEVLINGVLHRIPQDWLDFLLSVSNDELTQLMCNYSVHRNDVPDTFQSFIQKCRLLSLRLMWPQRISRIEKSGPRRNKKITGIKTK